MTLVSIKIDTRDLSRKIRGTVNYTQGFFYGVETEKITFMRFLAGFTREALYKYIDSRAKVNPNALHHVYEPNQVGSSSARLYKFSATATINNIMFAGEFLPSTRPSDTSDEPFRNKAEIMENGIAITITPKDSDFLVFEDNGETFFTRNSITIEHPGGDEVAGSFGMVVDDFFSQYLTTALFAPIFKDLQTADEYIKNFSSGTRAAGVLAGKRYLSVTGVGFE